MRDEQRRPEHRRNPRLEAVLALLARDLAPVAANLVTADPSPRLPSVFIVGCPRSGTTLAYQWLAATGLFTYPTNFTSRFPTAPWLAERVQQLLRDPACDVDGELTLDAGTSADAFRSRLGKTRGPFAAHEFWYWWRRFLPEGAHHALDAGQLARVDAARMQQELAAWEAVLGRPLLMKALILDWNLPWLARLLPQAVFVHVRRDPLLTMQSLLAARREFFGDERPWYSFRPAEYAQLATLEPVQQVAAQVDLVDRAVTAGLAGLPARRRLVLAYEDLCREPAAAYAQVIERLAAAGYAVDAPYAGPGSFPVRDALTGGDDEAGALRAAWAERTGCVLEPMLV
ncbi:MAG TPA: sulfotransferase [Candidatus Krumholzibacteria bacterium]|nr:sulfotransferase [Candidatus Krumholzibacteria bacterium]